MDIGRPDEHIHRRAVKRHRAVTTLREALRSSQQIMDSILKQQEKIDLSSKLMIMEQSILAVAQELPVEQQEKFYKRVERILGEMGHES